MKSSRFILGIALFAFLLLPSTQAQGIKHLYYGVKGGLGLSTFVGDNTDDASLIFGFAAGGFLSYHTSSGFSLQPEVLFVTKGAKFDVAGNEVTYNLNYIEVPILLKYYLARQVATQPYLFVGPSIGFLADATFDVSGVEGDVQDSKSLDFSVLAGIGVDFGLSNGTKVILDARYTYGTSGIVDNDDAVESDFNNSAFLFTLGFAF